MATHTERRGFLGQASRFVVVGVIGALIDSGVYALALHLDVWVHAARTLSFVCGTTAAYALNRRWAFRVSGGARQATGYAVLYGVMFFVILGANALALAVRRLAGSNPSPADFDLTRVPEHLAVAFEVRGVPETSAGTPPAQRAGTRLGGPGGRVLDRDRDLVARPLPRPTSSDPRAGLNSPRATVKIGHEVEKTRRRQ